MLYTTSPNSVIKFPHSHLTKAEFKPRLTDLKNKLTDTVSIDRLDIDYAPYSIGNVQLKKNEVVIKGGKSLVAEVSRNFEKLPSEYRFNIQKTLQQ